jgi:hypothetical protein
MVCNITSPITRTWLGNSAFDLRYRDGYDGNQNGVFNAPHPAVTGNSSFVQTLDQTFNGINGASSWYLGKNIAFIGHVGLSNCADSSDWHSKGRAFDLAAIYFTPGPYFMDANTTWRPQRTLLSKRLYLAIAANCRMYANTVITGYYPGDAGHDNHIHIDNGSPLGRPDQLGQLDGCNPRRIGLRAPRRRCHRHRRRMGCRYPGGVPEPDDDVSSERLLQSAWRGCRHADIPELHRRVRLFEPAGKLGGLGRVLSTSLGRSGRRTPGAVTQTVELSVRLVWGPWRSC